MHLQVMFTKRINVNVLDDNHIVALFIENGVAHNIADRLLIAFGKEQYRFRGTLWCFDQTCCCNDSEARNTSVATTMIHFPRHFKTGAL
jgi:hypothetical protein